MTLNEIAESMSAQILRMQKVRAIVATLLPAETTPAVETVPAAATMPAAKRSTEASSPASESIPDVPELEVTPDLIASPAPPPPPRKERKPREPRPDVARVVHATRVRVKELPATALRGAVPKGPVVVSAADVRSRPVLEPRPANPVAHTPTQSGHSLDDLVRQLTRRSGPGLSDRVPDDSSR